MAVICVADGGSGDSGQRAARVIEAELTALAFDAARYGYQDDLSCQRGVFSGRSAAPMSGRQFIEHIRQLTVRHQHLIVDVSGAPDHTAALAYGLADLTLIPLRPVDFDASSIIKTIGLLDILSAHRRRPLRHAVFLAGQAKTLTLHVHLQIAGLLAGRGVATLPTAFCDETGAVPGLQSKAFAQSVLAHLAEDQAAAPPPLAAGDVTALPAEQGRYQSRA